MKNNRFGSLSSQIRLPRSFKSFSHRGKAQQRLQKFDPNQLTCKPKEPGWQAYLRPYRDFMLIFLLGAAIVNMVVTGEWGSTRR